MSQPVVATDCDSIFQSLVRSNLHLFPRQAASLSLGIKQAAVAVTVIDGGHGADLSGMPRYELRQNAAALILTRRSSRLRNHAGQWAFPGGRVEPGESAEQTAQREMNEEIGIDLPSENILGCLDDFVTRSGFVITPVVFWGGICEGFTLNPDEVDSVHRIPVTEFLREDAPLLEATTNSEAPVLRMPVGDNWIAAPTAAIIYQFREVCVLGKSTRVSHYDQPKFAWK